MAERFQVYRITYRHEGEDWALNIPATSWQDAQARCRAIAGATVDGVALEDIPVEIIIFKDPGTIH